MLKISTRDAERILLSLFDVAEDQAAKFLERLKQLRHLGVPSGVPKGRGVRTGRTIEQMVELALAIHLMDAGLSSTHVARLMRTEWPLAASALNVLTWPEVRGASGEKVAPAEVFWVAEPQGLAEYRRQGDASLPRLATIVVLEGELLQDKIDEWTGRRGWTIAVIRARDVLEGLLATYLDLNLATEEQWTTALSDYRQSSVGTARAVLRDRKQ